MWVQCYDPLGNWPASTLAAALPVFVLLGLLAWGRLNAGGAALAGLSAACIMAFFVFGMPAEMILASAVMGLVFAAFRVVWLIVAAVFLYDIAVTTGQFEIMKASVASLSGDRRLQAVLVAFSFGAFIEGAAGFGAPVAISAAFLVGLGFQPFQAALLCLIANTAPVGLGGNRDSAADLERGHRAGCRGAQRHLRTDSPSAFGLDPVLAGPHHDRLAEHARSLAAASSHRGNLRRGPVSLVESGRFRAGGHRHRSLQHDFRGDRDPTLEARADLAFRPRGGSHTRCC